MKRWALERGLADRNQDRLWADIAQREMNPAAAALRPGIPFTIEGPSMATLRHFVYLIGMVNIHYPITFEDGAKWLGRLHSAPELGEDKDRVRAGEVAVIQTLRTIAPEFIPEVYIAPEQNGQWFDPPSTQMLIPQCTSCRSSSTNTPGASDTSCGPRRLSRPSTVSSSRM